MDVVIAIGVMSGTSADGIDAVLLQLQSVSRRHTPRVLAHVHRAFPARVRDDLLRPGKLDVQRVAELHFLLPSLYARAVRALPGWQRATVCGAHGQTIWHAPPPARPACTLQIGSSAVLAQALGVPVVGDLRSADVAVGGQGAPIVPFAHWFFTPPSACPRLVVNFGGICNFTYVTKSLDGVLAYDVGPGMMLSDAFAHESTRGRLDYDRNGELSRSGRIIEPLIADIAAHPFVARRPPKSTGREDFGRHFFEPLFRRYRRSPPADVARTLLAATATILRRAVERDRRIDAELGEVLLSGGGGKNPVLAAEVRARFPKATVRRAVDGVFAPEHHEASAMALIAARTARRLPSSLPAVTGAPRPVILGHLHQPTKE
ncbi:MAG TPA: anhydro-N-acetylmuramic acid kinase [Polyangiaceae bacterium]|nr:anhydro-N-acetylmuramic acid kinase [Polyangiaceae bacterium]